MLQQPSEVIMYQKFPLDLNMHSADVSNLQPDYKDIGLQLQAQRAAAATQAFFLDAYSVKSAGPSPVLAATAAEVPRPGIGIQGAYAYPFPAAYDPILLDRQQHVHHHHHHHHHQQQQQQHKPRPHLQIQQQQQQTHVPMASPSSMEVWQQQQRQQLEKRGCWFPNWQEVFHGFAASKGEKHVTSASFQQQPAKEDNVVMSSVTRMVDAPKSQQLNVHSNGTGQLLDPKPFSSPLPKHDAVPLPHVNVAERHDAHLHDRAELDGLSDLPPASSCLATAMVPCAAPLPERRSESSLVPFTDPRRRSLLPANGDIACKYITQSPAWLPPGWITEVQTRRSGSTAGTRDKYYKDLVSGRRFRSRNEVIHYLQTGKGRLRRRRRRKAIASSAFGVHVNYLTHHPHSQTQQETSSPCLFLSPEPIGFVLGPFVNTQSANSTPLEPPVVSQVEEASCQTPVSSLNVSSTADANHQSEEQSPRVPMFGLKRPVESRPQKLPIHKKAKILSPKKFEDKQASRLWQWLHKSARTDEQPQKQDAQKNTSMAEEKKASDIEDLDRELLIEQRTAQLSRDVEASQRTIAQLGKEMQATIEKLTQRVQTAKRDLKLEADAIYKTDYAMNGVMQATHRLDSAVGSLTEATQSLVLALDSARNVSHVPGFNVGTSSSTAKQPLAAGAGGVLQSALWRDVAMGQSGSSSYVAHVAGRINHAMGNTMHTHTYPDGVCTYASELSQGPDKLRARESQSTDACMHYASEPSHLPDNPGACITKAAQLSDVFALCAIQQAQRPGLVMCDSTKIPPSSVIIANYASMHATTPEISDATDAKQSAEKLSGDEFAYRKTLEVNKQITEARSMHSHRFPALNPELDRSSLSPSLSSRQRAKEVQKMKAKHARGLLVVLGRNLCYEAIHKSCEDDVLKQL